MHTQRFMMVAMDDEVADNDIAQVEARIEELGEAIERCRKLALAAKIAIGAGAAWIALTLLSVNPIAWIVNAVYLRKRWTEAAYKV